MSEVIHLRPVWACMAYARMKFIILFYLSHVDITLVNELELFEKSNSHQKINLECRWLGLFFKL